MKFFGKKPETFWYKDVLVEWSANEQKYIIRKGKESVLCDTKLEAQAWIETEIRIRLKGY